MTLSYEEFSNRMKRIRKAGNTVMLKCYKCDNCMKLMPECKVPYRWFKECFQAGCVKCKAPMYLLSFKKT